MFFGLWFQVPFLEVVRASSRTTYEYVEWDTKKRELVLNIASSTSVDDLSKIINKITGLDATLTSDQFKTLQDQISKAVAKADNEDAAKKAVIEVVSVAKTDNKDAAKVLPVPVDVNKISSTTLQQMQPANIQSFYRPSSFQLAKIVTQLYQEDSLNKGKKQGGRGEKREKLQPMPQRSSYQAYDLYENALKEWSRYVLRAFLHARHPFLLSEVRAKWTVPNKAEIPETAEILEKIIDSEIHTSADHVPYYHGMNSMATFLMVMYDVFFQVFQHHGLVPNFSKLRMSPDKKTFDQIFKSAEFSPFIMQHLEKTRLAANLLPSETGKLKYFDNNSVVTAHFMSAAPSVLADATTESPLFFFVNQVAIVLSESLLNMIVGNALRVVGVPEEKIIEQAQRYIVLAKEFAPQIKRAIAQIFIRDSIVNDVSYIAARGGLPFNYNPQDNSFFADTRGFLRYFGEGGYESLESYVQDHSELAHTELGQQFSDFKSGRTYWEHSLQVRILATSPLLEDPNNLMVKIFVDKTAEDPLKKLQEQLSKLATEDLALAKK